MKLQGKKLTDLLLLLAIGVFLFGSGYKVAEWKITTSARDKLTYTVFNAQNNLPRDYQQKNIDFALFWETWDKVEQKYVDKKKLDSKKMFYGAIKGMVASIEDPYTFFLTPEENKTSKDELGGKFQGIGAQLGMKDGKIVVIAPLKDSPAEAAGVKAGDMVVAVDGKSTEKWTLFEAVSKIRGKDGTKVELTLARADKKIKVSITRREIKVPSLDLSYEKVGEKSVAVIKLSQFGETTNAEWDKAAREIQDKYLAKSVHGLVIDLRGNPGGYLESAVHIASDLIPNGSTVVKQETTTQNDRIYTVQKVGILLDIPIAVLINQGSASASEILSGALRDYKRATLVGAKSFGKGSVQEPLDLNQGAGLHVTVAKWILPKGEWINGKGIFPHIVLENTIASGDSLTKENDAQMKKALEVAAK